jgi:hypothetical protein
VRLGIAFRAGADANWFQTLLAADPVASRLARSIPDRLSAQARVYLGRPPTFVLDFSATELEVLRRVGAGITIDALARAFGGEIDAPTAGALFSLVGRRLLVLDKEQSVGVGRWKHVLAGGGASPDRDGGRPPPAQQLYHEAMMHISAGRLGFAVDRLREAQRLAPNDATIESTLERLARWM